MKKNKKIKKPWPTKAAMEQVYEKKLWGENKSGFYSGIGSHKFEIIDPYIKVVRAFLQSFDSPIVVCDLGCGDFNVGKELVQYADSYLAVDIVRDLIERNKQVFKANNLAFYCLDIAVDDLPSGDCAVLRQVLQHLSNAEIMQILKKLKAFKYLILTEHLPDQHFMANEDIISGQGTRLKKKSGLNLLAPPFNFNVKQSRELLSVSLSGEEGRIVTTLYTIT